MHYQVKLPSVFKRYLGQFCTHPVCKSGEKTLAQNHRPISLISTFSKIIEKCLVSRMNSFLLNQKILHTSQFGFRKDMSTEDAVSLIYNQFTKNLDQKKLICAIFLDIKKAFDSVNHKILLTKLYRYGFRSNAFDLIASFLSNRTQSVLIQNSISTPLPIECGVPQGSVLGPLLFLLFINDLPSISNFSSSLFADDACLFLCNSSPTNLEIQVNSELAKISNWFKNNKLTLNYNKTFYMIFSTKKINYNFEIKIDNSVICEKQTVKYLGINIDAKLNWKCQIARLSSQIARGCWAISRIRRFVKLPILKLLYFTLVYPFLLYCITSWGTAAKTYFNKIFIIQKKIVRIMTFSSYTSHTNIIFKNLKLLKLADIFKLKTALYTYRSLNKNSLNLTNTYTLGPNYTHNTRAKNSGNLFVPQVNSTLGQRSCEYQQAITWNKVPPCIRKAGFARMFRNRYTKHLLDQY